jgi:hypothetical protein
MNRLYEIFKTPSGPSTGKALLNHTIFSQSQTGETVPLRLQSMLYFLYTHHMQKVFLLLFEGACLTILLYKHTMNVEKYCTVYVQ